MISMLASLAQWCNELGNTAKNRGRHRLAKTSYRFATRLVPRWSSPWYNLGLQAKYQCEWQSSLEYNQKAALLDSDDEATWWNLGIAATALRNWPEARRAWRGCGIKLDSGSGEVTWSPGTACVRLNPNHSGEVVWGSRLDPARIRLRNVPLPESNHRYGDIVLNDGAAEGTRTKNGREYPVFNELQVWQPSRHSTFRSTLSIVDNAAEERLLDLCHENNIGAEDWGTIRHICAECSRGNPGPHDCVAQHQTDDARNCGFGAVDREILLQVLSAWSAEATDREFTEPALELFAASDAHSE